MSGHVFHPGHHELHGITVVVETPGSLIYVGRFDSADDKGVHLVGVSVHDSAGNGLTRAEFLARTLKYGIKVDRPHLVVPAREVARVSRLVEGAGC